MEEGRETRAAVHVHRMLNAYQVPGDIVQTDVFVEEHIGVNKVEIVRVFDLVPQPPNEVFKLGAA